MPTTESQPQIRGKEKPLKVLIPLYTRRGEPPQAPPEMKYLQVGEDNATSLVTHAGLMPIFVFSGEPLEMIEEADAMTSAVYLPPGVDIRPSQYGQDPHPKLKLGKNPDRDPFELMIARNALEMGKPLLGDCRGAQVAAVAAGGELEQHTPDITDEPHGFEGKGRDPVYPSTYRHPIRTVPGTILREVYGAETPGWPTIHHQAIKAPNPDAPREERFMVSGYSPGGRVVEAIEVPRDEHPFFVGIQGHVEFGNDGVLIFEALANAARGYAALHK